MGNSSGAEVNSFPLDTQRLDLKCAGLENCICFSFVFYGHGQRSLTTRIIKKVKYEVILFFLCSWKEEQGFISTEANMETGFNTRTEFNVLVMGLKSLGPGYFLQCLLSYCPAYQLSSFLEVLLFVLLSAEVRQVATRDATFSVGAPCLWNDSPYEAYLTPAAWILG